MSRSCILRRFRILATGALGALLLGHASAAEESPLPAWCAEGFIPEPVALAHGNHTIGCEIAPATDLDGFVFEGSAGERVRLNLLSTANYFDARIEVRDPSGLVVADGYCDGGGYPARKCSLSVDVILDQTGSHSVSVSDLGANESGSYGLSLERLLPGDDRPVLHAETTTDAIDPATDMDFLAFEGVAGTVVRIGLLSQSHFFDPRIEVWTPGGEPMLDDSCDGGGYPARKCSRSWDLSVAETGPHLIAISDVATNETGGYELGIACLFGPCDTDGDGHPDGDPEILRIGQSRTDSIEPATALDSFGFQADLGTVLRFNLLSLTHYFDPRVEVRDPAGNVVHSQLCDGGGYPARKCSFSFDFEATVTGVHRLAVHDYGNDEPGGYEIGLQCVVGECSLTPWPEVGDNCDRVPNPDQADEDGDDVGDVCEICGDGIDNDGDGATDLEDVSCRHASWNFESTACSDGVDNDGDGRMDFDGGLSAGADPTTEPDPECKAEAWRTTEAPCGGGFQAAFVLPPLVWAAKRRRRRPAA